jgi:cytochrome oxidase Cu insertion factor (SCO1/SenC/PrrC family)
VSRIAPFARKFEGTARLAYKSLQVRAVLVLGLSLAWFQIGTAAKLIPVHGYVLSPPRNGNVIMRVDRVVGMLPGGVYAVRLPAAGGTFPSPGTEVDALLTQRGSALSLYDRPVAAPRFVAGSVNPLIKHILTAGDRAPAYTLVDQDGRPLRLDRISGKVTVLSFVFSRCPDETVCPAISGKFAYLQSHLDPRYFHLVEVTLDPVYDSPAVLSAYGRRFDANPRIWSLVTGEPSEVKDVIDAFGVASIANGSASYIHNVRLVLIDRHGIVHDVVQTADWNPDDVVAMASNIAGFGSNPLRRFWFATVANLAAFCGGNASVATTLLLVVSIGGMSLITIPLLIWITRRWIILG